MLPHSVVARGINALVKGPFQGVRIAYTWYAYWWRRGEFLGIVCHHFGCHILQYQDQYPLFSASVDKSANRLFF